MDNDTLRSNAVSFANRVRGNIKLQNGTGIVNLTIKEAQLEDGGVFHMNLVFATTYLTSDEESVSLDVKGLQTLQYCFLKQPPPRFRTE